MLYHHAMHHIFCRLASDGASISPWITLSHLKLWTEILKCHLWLNDAVSPCHAFCCLLPLHSCYCLHDAAISSWVTPSACTASPTRLWWTFPEHKERIEREWCWWRQQGNVQQTPYAAGGIFKFRDPQVRSAQPKQRLSGSELSSRNGIVDLLNWRAMILWCNEALMILKS